jgi:hypothetical protein
MSVDLMPDPLQIRDKFRPRRFPSNSRKSGLASSPFHQDSGSHGPDATVAKTFPFFVDKALKKAIEIWTKLTKSSENQ